MSGGPATQLPDDNGGPRATIRQVVGVAEFRALWIAHAQSRFGDQLARVAVAVLVFDRTSSAFLTALTYALTLIPPLISAPLLSGLADRHPRRRVMVTTELCRAGLVTVMAVPGVPLAVLVALLVCVVALQPLYSAARNAMLPNVLHGDRYVVGIGLTGTTDNVVQVVGFAAGGVLMGLTGASGALALNAITFLVSATLVRLGTGEHRPVVGDGELPMARTAWTSMSWGFALIWSDRRLRYLLALVYVYGFYIAPEGLAAPYAGEIGEGTIAVGLLMAADPVGSAIGILLLTRCLRPDRRESFLAPLAVAAGVPMVLSGILPSLPAALVLWALLGVLSSYTMLAHALFVRMVPDGRRGQAVGLASAGLQTAQGLGILVAGLAAEVTSPSAAIGIMGAVGAVIAGLAGRAWNHARSAQQPILHQDAITDTPTERQSD